MRLNGKQWVMFLLIFVSSFISSEVFSVSDDDRARCIKMFEENPNLIRERFGDKLKDFPVFEEFLSGVFADETVPLSVKRILTHALSQDLKIVDFTKEVRKKYNFYNVGALYAWTRRTYYHMSPLIKSKQGTDRGLNSNLNSAANHSEIKNLVEEFVIFVPYSESKNLASSFFALIHELAHVRYQGKMAGWLDPLCDRLGCSYLDFIPAYDDPDFDERHNNIGDYKVHGQFDNLINERYAREVEYQLWLHTSDNDLAQVDLSFMEVLDEVDKRDPQKAHKAIADFVVDKYGINDPQVLKFKYLPLSQILLSKEDLADLDDIKLFNEDGDSLDQERIDEMMKRILGCLPIQIDPDSATAPSRPKAQDTE